ncbi:hypothetical protein FACS1894205_2450 [Alphaproteobacteria bacterium]|nr:hypothetical protein FACS1894205_2450 [Alphaproteobacteria bacterium]
MFKYPNKRTSAFPQILARIRGCAPDDPDNIDANFRDYFVRFSPNVRGIGKKAKSAGIWWRDRFRIAAETDHRAFSDN